ncbi:hypothetical protein [Roseovarius salinarum]|uniref:hypothetical protein n=1 Tax=Roseovarius salinarum TaxID=1981892 RepID=UPI000C34A44A|nr:hypothetical protein [Roseovarius salinarum]
MTTPSPQVRELLNRHGQLFSAQLDIDLRENEPAGLWLWFCAVLLLSAPISADVAMRAARALRDAGWQTPRETAQSSWDDRVRTLNTAGYARYDEKTATMLGEVAEKTLDAYGGDLRGLRGAGQADAARLCRRLQDYKGIGPVGAGIFLREAQLAWPEFHPFADARALKAAGRLGLPETAEGLAACVDRDSFPALLTALVRADLAGETGG